MENKCLISYVRTRGGENKVKDRVKKALQDAKIWHVAIPASGFSSLGVPDFLACVWGCFVSIEAKNDAIDHLTRKKITRGPNKGKIMTIGGPSPEQRRCMKAIRDSKGLTLVVDRHTIAAFELFVQNITQVRNKLRTPTLTATQLAVLADKFDVLYDTPPEL